MHAKTKMAKLMDLIGNIDGMAPEDVICAKHDWRPDSEAKIVQLTEDYRVPADIKAEGYEYFLEADVIRQILEEFQNHPDASIEEKCARIIQYAICDA